MLLQSGFIAKWHEEKMGSFILCRHFRNSFESYIIRLAYLGGVSVLGKTIVFLIVPQ